MFPIATITWIDAQKERPDAERTVLIHCTCSEDPIWFGWWDGEMWCDIAGDPLAPAFVTHWAEFPEPPGRKPGRGGGDPTSYSALRALETVEFMLRRQPAYHLAMDGHGKVGLGKWILRVIRRLKKGGGR